MSAEYILQKNYFSKRKILGNYALVQLGRMECHPSHTVGMHTHLDWFEITSVIGGEGEILANGQKMYISKGDVYLSFPCETHAIFSSEQHPLKFDFLSFVPVNDKKTAQYEELMNKVPRSEARLMKESRLQSLCDGCVNAFLMLDKDKYKFLSLSLELMTMEMMAFFGNARYESDTKNKTRENVLCSAVKRYIDTHIFSLRSLDELSAVTSYNYSYLSNVYKKVMGQTISDYYNDKRFEKAKILLKEGGRSVTDISFLLGYSSVYAFSKAFKDRTGVPPTRYLDDNFRG